MRAQRQRICDGRLYVACLQRDYRKAAMILTAFAKHDRPGADAMRLFFQEILVHIDAKYARALQAARHFDPDLAPVLGAALLWADGKSAEALDKLDIIPKSFPARVQAAELKRAFLLEGRHHEQFAEDGIRRLADVAAEAAAVGLQLRERLDMPANNKLLAWQRPQAHRPNATTDA